MAVPPAVAGRVAQVIEPDTLGVKLAAVVGAELRGKPEAVSKRADTAPESRARCA